MKERDLNNVFSKIVNVAEKPHLSFPETDAGRNRKRYCQLVNHSLIFVSDIFYIHSNIYLSFLALKGTNS